VHVSLISVVVTHIFLQVIKASQLPLPLNKWKMTRFPGDGGKPLECHTARELRTYLDYRGVDKDHTSGVNLYAVAYRK
jgi:hypothetical protein